MTPERLRGFLKKLPNGCARVHVLHDNGYGTGGPVVSFEREEVEGYLDPSLGGDDLPASILNACQEHCDAEGETTKYLIQWVTRDGRPLQSIPHKISPDPDNKDVAPSALARRSSADDDFQSLLQMNLALCKAQPMAFSTVMKSYEGVIKVLSDQNASQAQALRSQDTEVAQLRARVLQLQTEIAILQGASKDKSDPEDEQSAQIRREAWRKLQEYGPDIARLAFEAFKGWAGSSGAVVAAEGLNGATATAAGHA